MCPHLLPEPVAALAVAREGGQQQSVSGWPHTSTFAEAEGRTLTVHQRSVHLGAQVRAVAGTGSRSGGQGWELGAWRATLQL